MYAVLSLFSLPVLSVGMGLSSNNDELTQVITPPLAYAGQPQKTITVSRTAETAAITGQNCAPSPINGPLTADFLTPVHFRSCLAHAWKSEIVSEILGQSSR